MLPGAEARTFPPPKYQSTASSLPAPCLASMWQPQAANWVQRPHSSGTEGQADLPSIPERSVSRSSTAGRASTGQQTLPPKELLQDQRAPNAQGWKGPPGGSTVPCYHRQPPCVVPLLTGSHTHPIWNFEGCPGYQDFTVAILIPPPTSASTSNWPGHRDFGRQNQDC